METIKKVDKRPWYKKKRVIIPVILVLMMILANQQAENKKQMTRAGSVSADRPTVSENKLNPAQYEIMKTNHYPAVENFHILVKQKNLKTDSLQKFIDRFRKEFCSKQCNISLYDDGSVKSLVTKYPIEGKEYIKLADHFVAMSSFDVTDVWMYPYQDFKYKELGGKHWKKEPM